MQSTKILAQKNKKNQFTLGTSVFSVIFYRQTIAFARAFYFLKIQNTGRLAAEQVFWPLRYTRWNLLHQLLVSTSLL